MTDNSKRSAREVEMQLELDRQKRVLDFLRGQSHECMMGIVERSMLVFARGQGIYNAVHYPGYEPILERDVSVIFELLRELFLKPKPVLEPDEPSPLGGIGGNASAVWMKWYRTKHGVSLSESRDAGIKRRAEFAGEYTGVHVEWPAV